MLAATGAAIATADASWWLALALPAHGVSLVFLFAPFHETIHHTAFRGRRLNDAVAWFCGAVLMPPSVAFRHFHLAHHRYTQDPARDPELRSPSRARA